MGIIILVIKMISVIFYMLFFMSEVILEKIVFFKCWLLVIKIEIGIKLVGKIVIVVVKI